MSKERKLQRTVSADTPPSHCPLSLIAGETASLFSLKLWVLDTAMPMLTAHIHSGRHSLGNFCPYNQGGRDQWWHRHQAECNIAMTTEPEIDKVRMSLIKTKTKPHKARDESKDSVGTFT